MVSLRRVNRNTPNSGFNKKSIMLILAATVVLILWGFQKIYLNDGLEWLLYLAIGIGIAAFVLLIIHIIKIWTNHRKRQENTDREIS